jgi:hypothetical protein
MSSRVRIIGSHPTYGVAWGGKVVYYIEDSWAKKFKHLDINQLAPLGFQAWTHWKRALWMAKFEGSWVIKAFREPREAKMSRSQYGKAFQDWGMVIPRRKVRFVNKDGKKVAIGYNFKVGINKPQQRVHAVDIGQAEIRAAQRAMDGLLGGPIAGGVIGQAEVPQPALVRQMDPVVHQMNWQWQVGANVAVAAPVDPAPNMAMYHQIAEDARRAAGLVAQEQRRRPLYQHWDDVAMDYLPDPEVG